jgi:hypothetical protein
MLGDNGIELCDECHRGFGAADCRIRFSHESYHPRCFEHALQRIGHQIGEAKFRFRSPGTRQGDDERARRPAPVLQT